MYLSRSLFLRTVNCGVSPNLLITPHVSGGFHLPYTVDRIVEISLKNLAAYIHHEEYVSVVDRATGYKVSGSL